ncbi:MAG: PASTA domain-containing protein, partial [Clostridia bacterium]|nr:PASTA domain-containing protein [Clostridia bacterium]
TKKKKKKKKGKHSGTMFPIILGIAIPFLIVSVVLAILLGVTFMKNMGFTDSAVWEMQPFKLMYSIYTTFFHNPGFDQTVQEEATFPNLIGMTYDQALISQLHNGTFGYSFEIKEDAVTYTSNPSFENGTIIHTEPTANAIRKGVRKNGKTVYVFTSILVNRIQTTSVIPDVVGYTKSDARVTMMNKHNIPGDAILFEEETDPAYNNMFDGQVTRTVPAAGETYHKGDVIVVYICTRPESATTGKMPSLTGLDVNFAIRLCEYALYRVEIVDFPMVGGDNTIREQSIPADTVSDKGTTVVLTVSRPMNSMPYLLYTKLSEAEQLLTEMGIPYRYELYGGVYESDPAVSTRGTDYEKQIERLTLIGGYPDLQRDENTTVIFQSIAAGSPPSETEPVVLIAVNFEDELF